MKKSGIIAYDFNLLGNTYAYTRDSLFSNNNTVFELHYNTIYDFKKVCPHLITIYIFPTDIEIAKEEDTMIHFLSMGSFVQEDQLKRMDDYNMGIYKGMFERIAKRVEDICRFYEENPFPMEKMNIYHTSIESRARTEQRIRNSGLAVAMAYSEISSLEISAQGVDKGVGLKKLCEYLDIPIDQTIAVGDADNDLGALKYAGLAIAMGNANEHVKKIADVIVADCDHEGCAEAIETYLL